MSLPATTMSANGTVTADINVTGKYAVNTTGTFAGGTLAFALKPKGHSTSVSVSGLSFTSSSVTSTVELAVGDVLTGTLTGATSPAIIVSVTQVG